MGARVRRETRSVSKALSRTAGALGVVLAGCAASTRGAPAPFLSAAPPDPSTASVPTIASQPVASAAPSASHPGYVHGPGSWFALPGRGVCPRTQERTSPPPPRAQQDCAYFRGCERRVRSRPVEKCSPDLETVTIRDLRAEGGARAEGTPIAVRGAFTLKPVLEKGEGLPMCHPRTWHAMLSSPEPTDCISAVLDIDNVPSPFTCMGDGSDRCCRANPNLPPLGADTVVLGRYRGLGNTQHADIDILWIDRFCDPTPAAPGKTK